MEKYPDVQEMKGKSTYVYVTTKKVDNDGRIAIAERVLTKVETNCTEEDCYETLVKARAFMEKKTERHWCCTHQEMRCTARSSEKWCSVSSWTLT